MEKCYQFHINGMSFSAESMEKLKSDQKYFSYLSLGYEKDSRCSKENPLLIKSNGEKAYFFHEDIPTFDSADRDYDSDHVLYLIPKNGMFEGLFVCYGYEVSEVYYYPNIIGENEAGKELLKRLSAE